jgi:uncharacterized protein DUF4154
MKPILRVLLIIIFITIPHFKIQADDIEYKVKAAFIHKFIKYVKWPANKLKSSDKLFSIGVIGNNKIFKYLKIITKNILIKNLHVKVEKVNVISSKNYHILFISQVPPANLKDILSIAKDKSILTISDVDGYAEKGVMVNFYKAGHFTRFKINIKSVKRSDIYISSKLLKISKIIGEDK